MSIFDVPEIVTERMDEILDHSNYIWGLMSVDEKTYWNLIAIKCELTGEDYFFFSLINSNS